VELHAMHEFLLDLIDTLSALPTEDLLIVLALAAFGLAAFAIYAVQSIAKDRDRR
jgi:hypothetical protein